MILFGLEPNGPPLERIWKTIAGEDEDLQNQNRIRGPGEDRGNPPMPKSAESLGGRGFRNARMCSRPEENVPLHGTVPVPL